MPSLRRVALASLVVALTAVVAPLARAAQPAPPRQTVKLWFTAGEQFKTVERELPATGTTLLPLLRALLAGPTRRSAGPTSRRRSRAA
jgi:hypothetical protein